MFFKMATSSSSSVESEALPCPECKSRKLMKDACASEDMLVGFILFLVLIFIHKQVCHNCGHIVEAGSLCHQIPSLQSSGMEGMRQTRGGGGSSRYDEL